MTQDEILFDPYTYAGSNNVERIYGYAFIASSILLFGVINLVVYKRGPPKKLRGGGEQRWRNTLVSWIHAVIVGSGVTYSILFKPEMHTDGIRFCDYFTYLLLSLSLGYFIYDVFDFVLSGNAWSGKEVITHHIAVIIAEWYVIHYQMYLGYIIIGLLIEVNSIFLHGRKLAQLSQWRQDQWPYRSIVTLNFVTFILLRMGSILYCLHLSVRGMYEYTPFIRYYLGVFVFPSFFLLNVVLMWKLYKSDIVRARCAVEKQNGVVVGNGNNKKHL